MVDAGYALNDKEKIVHRWNIEGRKADAKFDLLFSELNRGKEVGAHNLFKKIFFLKRD